MEWTAPAIVLDARPLGEGDAVVSVMTEAHGRHRGLARGGGSRKQASLWQPGNLVQARWLGRLAEQLGTLSAELAHPAAALAMEDALALAVLAACCAVADGTLPERESHPRVFAGLLGVLAGLGGERSAILTALVRWEAELLAELGYGLDLRVCAITGVAQGLAFVSPRTGRAVSGAAAGDWAPRLLALPAFLTGAEHSTPADWRDGLRLTGHFLARDAFGAHHRPLPQARLRLFDRVAGMAA
jgi:DNA repair protein RecO (recombination protein O)